MATTVVKVKTTSTAALRVSFDGLAIALDASGNGLSGALPVFEELPEGADPAAVRRAENLALSTISWVAMGDPGATYKIELAPTGSNLKLEPTRGKFPIESAIATTRFRGAGHVDFLIRRSSE